MTDYNDGKWHGWGGGECPVHPKSEVEAVSLSPYYNGADYRKLLASSISWNDNDTPVVAFRVIKEHKAPREFWIFENGHGDLCVSEVWRRSGIHVREVLEGEE
jgi:hypothetical protein